MRSRLRHPLVAIAVAICLTLPWLVVWPLLSGSVSDGTIWTVVLSGTSVLGASFLLAWGAETAEKDVPRAFALAVLAVLAVAPEYAVDALYAWEAGRNPGSNAASLAVANMTGANRILIGLGWSGIAIYTIYRATRTSDRAVEQVGGFLRNRVMLDRNIAKEVVFLFVATLVAFLVPIGSGIGWVDMAVLVGLYVGYIWVALNGPDTHEDQIGIPAYLQNRAKPYRIATVITLFVFSGAVILLAVEPFAHGLEDLGTDIGIPPFLMIQWVAPLASESPELIVVAYLVNKGRSTAGFNALISSKLNQWTLLIGTLVVVYSIALGSYGALPLDQKQTGEIWLTAAQSFFALSILANFRISVRESLLLLVLFVTQLHPWFHHYEALLGFSVIYMVLGVAFFVRYRASAATVAKTAYWQIRHARNPPASRVDRIGLEDEQPEVPTD